MALSRKHYVKVAAILAGDLATSNTDAERRKVRAIALSLADMFAQDNAAFNRSRFYTACGIGADGFAFW